MSGPDPKYTAAERAAQGNPGNRAVVPAAPNGADLPEDLLLHVPSPPEFMTGNNTDISVMSVRIWQEVAPLLVEARTLREGDLFALARYCRYAAEWCDATEQVDLLGTIINSARGMQRNPALLHRATVEKELQALERELGLSPKARIEVQKKLMHALKDLPLSGDQTKGGTKQRGPIGILNASDD